MAEDFLPVDFVAELDVAAPFLPATCELEVVVVVVSALCAQEARKATPTSATIEERKDFFIGSWLVKSFQIFRRAGDSKQIRGAYSARRATIGFTRVARRAGTKTEAAATADSSPATAK